MATAREILPIESSDWLSVLADDGLIYRYERRQERADLHHIQSKYERGMVAFYLAVDGQGNCLLRQVGDGLPQRIGVHLVNSIDDKGAVVTHWSGTVTYELVSSERASTEEAVTMPAPRL